MDCFSGKSSRNWLVVTPPHNPNLVLNSLDVPFAELWKKHFQKMTTNMGGPPTNIEDAFLRWTNLEDVWITFDSPGKRSIFVARSIVTGEHGNTRTTSYHGTWGRGVNNQRQVEKTDNFNCTYFKCNIVFQDFKCMEIHSWFYLHMYAVCLYVYVDSAWWELRLQLISSFFWCP